MVSLWFCCPGNVTLQHHAGELAGGGGGLAGNVTLQHHAGELAGGGGGGLAGNVTLQHHAGELAGGGASLTIRFFNSLLLMNSLAPL